jgi:hypothetical protein
MEYIAAFIIIVYGLILIISPKTGSMIGHRWRYKSAEPSNILLIWARIAGVICIILAIWLIFGPLSFG